MTRTHNPIQAVADAVTPYVVTGEAEAAFGRWKRAEPVLARIEGFDELQGVLAAAAESCDAGFALQAMLRLYDAGDCLACLVVLQAFVPPLYRAAIALRFRVRHSLEVCARRMLFGFCSAVSYREDAPVPGAALVTRARCEADHSIAGERCLALIAPAGRLSGLRAFGDEVVASASLLADLIWILRNEWAQRRRARRAAGARWEVLGGRLCRDGVPVPTPESSPLVDPDRSWGPFAGRAARAGARNGEP